MSETGEIIKSGAFDKLVDLIHKLAGPMADEIGLMMGDKIKVYRVRNWVETVKKTQRILSDADLPPSAVPPRLLLPILESASVESDESLQELWAGLLATASQKADSLSPSFVETLKQLTPAQAKDLNRLFDFAKTRPNFTLMQSNSLLLSTSGSVDRLTTEAFERLGLIHREYDLQEPRAISNWFRRGIRNPPQNAAFFGSVNKDELPELTYEFAFTEYGVQFMNACRGPMKQNASIERAD
jgi:hypothetical protein